MNRSVARDMVEGGVMDRMELNIQEMVAREVALRNQVNEELYSDLLTYPEEDAREVIIDMDTADGISGAYERIDFSTMQETSDFYKRRSGLLLAGQAGNSVFDMLTV